MPDRLNFGKLEEVLEIPDLIGIQLDSYASFLQLDTPPEKRLKQGLQEIFMDVFPVTSIDKNITLEFLSYNIGKPKKKSSTASRTVNPTPPPSTSISNSSTRESPPPKASTWAKSP